MVINMKGLVLAGGSGTRLRPITFTTAKQLLPVANRPILGYVLDKFANSGIRDVGIIIAPDTGAEVKKYVGDGSNWKINVTYILQEPLGLAHAVKTAHEFLGNATFVMYLGDNLLGEGIDNLIHKFEKEKLDALVLLKEVENPEEFGVAVLNDEGRVVKLIEKPKKPPTNLALVGVYIFSPNIHKAIDRIKPSRRKELEITEAIQELISRGYNVKNEILDSWWLDTGKKDDVLTANTIVLDEFVERDIKCSLHKSEVIGRVKVEEGTNLINSRVQGPAIIGKNSLIENSFIGPYSSIGDNVKVIDSTVENSVILEGSRVHGIERLEDSLIGRNTKVTKSQNKHDALRLMIGDYSEVEL